jgi:hypothetical protein
MKSRKIGLFKSICNAKNLKISNREYCTYTSDFSARGYNIALFPARFAAPNTRSFVHTNDIRIW